MRKANSSSWARVVLAFAAVLLVGGSSLVFADPGSSYAPTGCSVLGPSAVSRGSQTQYTLRVTFSNGDVGLYPSLTGAVWSALNGPISSTGVLTGAATGPRAKVTGSFTQAGVRATCNKIVDLN